METSIALLGEFQFTKNTTKINLNPGAARMIAALALYGPQPLSRCALGALLWPRKSSDRRSANLRGMLWRLPPPAKTVLAIDGESVGLEPRTTVDTQLLGNDGVGALDLHQLAAPLLPGWYDDWVLVERDRLCSQQIAALEARAEQSLGSGHPDAAIEAALASIMIEPLREAPHRLVLRGHLAEGNVAEALAHLVFLREMFSREVGAEVTSQTCDLLLDCREVTDGRRTLV